MKRPLVTAENHQDVYEYFGARTPNPKTARFLHRLFGVIYHPNTALQKDAEHTITEHFKAGGQMLVAARHVSAHDPLVLASVVQHETALRPLIGTIFIPAHVGLFKHRTIRPFLDNFVALPTYRGKDIAKLGLPADDAEALRASTGKAFVEMSIAKINEGWDFAIFPSGSRKENTVRSGIGRIACNLKNPDNVRILPIAIDYSQTATNLNPNVFVGAPLELPKTSDAVTALVTASLQACVDRAEAM